INCEPQIEPIKKGQSGAFSAVTSSDSNEMRGFATFVMNDDISTALTISWNVSRGFPGRSSFRHDSFFFDKLSEEKYGIERKVRLDNTVHVTVSQKGSGFWVIFNALIFFLAGCSC